MQPYYWPPQPTVDLSDSETDCVWVRQMRTVRAQALQEFKKDPTIDVLLMDGVATVGHDLSFVSDIICMESITQKEAWNQLVSRAYLLRGR